MCYSLGSCRTSEKRDIGKGQMSGRRRARRRGGRGFAKGGNVINVPALESLEAIYIQIISASIVAYLRLHI